MCYEPVIGLEIHAELCTETKLFCSCRNEFGGAPNSNCCPVCTGMPGTLPVPNREALSLAVRAGKAFGCDINSPTRQYRKHYFYPDLPKGYQISQYKNPLAVNGFLDFEFEGSVRRVNIRQIHIEEDAAKLLHGVCDETYIDYNRAGVPLIEIVTEPEIRSADEARAFLEAVRVRLMYIGVSHCRMEQGALRCDVNVSLKKKGSSTLGERVEMKNINTFSAVARAIEYEIKRQKTLLSEGVLCRAETRRWDDEKRESFLMRTKENAMDYKFIPEPDIPWYAIDSEFISKACEAMPESEISRRKRYVASGVAKEDARMITEAPELAEFLDKCQRFTDNICECAKLLCGDVLHFSSESGVSIEDSRLTPQSLSETVKLFGDGKINRDSMKKIVKKLFFDGGSACEKAADYVKITDEAVIFSHVFEVLSENEKAVSDYKAGKMSALKYLMGSCMRRLGGRADALLLEKLLTDELNKRCN